MVRYAEQPTATVEVDIAAPASVVWPLVSDIELPARFSTEFQGASWLPPAEGPAVGAQFRGRNQHPAGGEWETTSIVVDCEPDRCFGWQVEGPAGTMATWRFELEPTEHGCRLRQWAQMGPGPSGLTPAIERWPDKEEKIVGRRLDEWRANMAATVDGIRALAEQQWPRP